MRISDWSSYVCSSDLPEQPWSVRPELPQSSVTPPLFLFSVGSGEWRYRSSHCFTVRDGLLSVEILDPVFYAKIRSNQCFAGKLCQFRIARERLNNQTSEFRRFELRQHRAQIFGQHLRRQGRADPGMDARVERGHDDRDEFEGEVQSARAASERA